VSCGVPTEKISTVHNGIEMFPLPNQQNSLRSELNIDENSMIVGVASRIDPVKGLEFLLDAAAKLLADGEDIDVVIAGDGNHVNTLKEQAERLKLTDRVHFVGFQSNIQQWLELFDIFALPSRSENHSIALLEAMRAQKAIVATDVGGNTESVRDDKEALIVPAADALALYTAIRRLIYSPDLRNKLSLGARQRFEERFTEETTKSKLTHWLLSFGEQQ
jgi:glycosyltransferase involved in cell wall biosynthesis